MLFAVTAVLMLYSCTSVQFAPLGGGQKEGTTQTVEDSNLSATPPIFDDQTPDDAGGSNTMPPTETELTADEKLAMQIRAQIKERMVENTTEYKVLYCGASDNPTLADGEKAIWVQTLSWRPYGTTADKDKSVVKPVYFYYPMHDDPSQYSNTQLRGMGATRVFAYMGIPESASEANPTQGLVCVHGGNGHAYADYVLEAVRHGYAAIAFDTEGCYAESGLQAEDLLKDILGHKGKDQFTTARESLDKQWMYYAVSDIAFANTVLRSLVSVDVDKVGITGISWGGLATTVATCYDSRFAFSVPIYLSYFLNGDDNAAAFSIPAFGALVWQNQDVLASNRVPTLLINSHSDPFADINSTMRTYHTLKANNEHTYVIVKPYLPHSQQAGASVAEIYRFGNWVCSAYKANDKGFFATDRAITKNLGRNFSFELTVPMGIGEPAVMLFYTTAPIGYASEGTQLTTVSEMTPTLTLLRTEDDGDTVYRVDVTVPATAYLYYLSYQGSSTYDAGIPITYPYTDYETLFYGKIYGSTEIILLGNGTINEQQGNS